MRMIDRGTASTRQPNVLGSPGCFGVYSRMSIITKIVCFTIVNYNNILKSYHYMATKLSRLYFVSLSYAFVTKFIDFLLSVITFNTFCSTVHHQPLILVLSFSFILLIIYNSRWAVDNVVRS